MPLLSPEVALPQCCREGVTLSSHPRELALWLRMGLPLMGYRHRRGLGGWKGQLRPAVPWPRRSTDSSPLFLGSWNHPIWTQTRSPTPVSPGSWTPNQTLSGASAPSMRPLSSNHPLPVSTSLTVPCHPIFLLFSTLLPAADAKAPPPLGPALLLGSSCRHCTLTACT